MNELSDTISVTKAKRIYDRGTSVAVHSAENMFADVLNRTSKNQMADDAKRSHMHALIEQSRNIFGQNMLQSDSSESAEASSLDALKAGATELVATTFIQPMFAMLRNDPLRSELFPESSGEKMFGPMLDAELAKRIVSSGNLPLTNAVVRQLQTLGQKSPDMPAEAGHDQNAQRAYEMSQSFANILGEV